MTGVWRGMFAKFGTVERFARRTTRVTTRHRTGPGRPSPVIPAMEATKAVNFHRNDALVVSTSSALRDWSQVSERRDLDVDISDCMDRAPAVGLGLALAQPEGKVLVLDFDSTLRTNLGGLATIGESNPKNLSILYSTTFPVPRPPAYPLKRSITWTWHR
ncbi:MAG: hypothetical protein Ct9H300mP11_08870 [Chloroflexota bacterium]|nr:MAG: hypothetical protein Ct9H300mP11_08870 [Chloroflexota bacterium]